MEEGFIAKLVMTGKKWGMSYILTGFIFILVATIFFFFVPPPVGHSIGLLGGGLVAGILSVAYGLYVYVREGSMPVADERSGYIQMRAGYWSWFASWLLMGILAIMTASGIFQIDYGLIVWVTWMFIIPGTFIAFRLAFSRQGIVENR